MIKPAMHLRTLFARNVRVGAEAIGLPLNQLADRAGISRSHLYLVLACDSAPTLDVVARLANALGRHPQWLLGPAPRR
jgi:DNA-binding phage protein